MKIKKRISIILAMLIFISIIPLSASATTMYRYRTRSTTSSTSSSLSGWTKRTDVTNPQITYGSWGNWSDWDINAISSNDTTEVKTETVYGYYYFQCPSCGNRYGAWNFYCWGSCLTYVPESSWHQMWSTTSWNSVSWENYRGTGRECTYNLDGTRWFKWSDTNGGSKTGYSYRTRTANTTYYYEQWSDWSNWSTTYVSANSDTQVETMQVDCPGNGSSHSWNSGVITKASTCAEYGVKTYTCTACGETTTESINKTTNHSWNNGVISKSPTCVEYGVKTYTCTACGKTTTESIEKNTIHSWNNGVITTYPTVSSSGIKTFTCTACGTTKTEEIIRDSVPSTSVSLNKTTLSLTMGNSSTLTATMSPSNTTDTVSWSSSNTSVATVTDGMVSAIAAGTATITATTSSGKTATCTVTVSSTSVQYSVSVTFETGKSIDVSLNSQWFENDCKTYQHELARFASMMTVKSYASMKKIQNVLSDFGFETDGTGFTSYWVKKENSELHKNGYYITKQQYGDKTLVMVLCRGTNGNEWYSDFMPGEGSTHYSFDCGRTFVLQALNQYLIDNNLNNNPNLKILVTGHSRGAAVANLLGQSLDDNYQYPQNVYCYTFATPNVSTKAKTKTAPTGEKYDNIYNIVNPEDFVTKVMPSAWGYGRYGVTYSLPSKTNVGKEYLVYLSNMKTVFTIMTGENYAPYEKGEYEVATIINQFTTGVKDVKAFYHEDKKIYLESITSAKKMKPYEFFQKTLCVFVSGTASKYDIEEAAVLSYNAVLNPIAAETYRNLIEFFLDEQGLGMGTDMLSKRINKTYFYELFNVSFDWSVSNPYFAYAHQAETYYSYISTLTKEQLSSDKGHKYFTVNCPVNVEVYDKETNELVGKITNNVVDEVIAAKENSIVMTVDGDEKTIILPTDGRYDVKYIANDDGDMDITVYSENSTTSDSVRENFFDVELINGLSYSSTVQKNTVVSEEYVLIDEDNHTVSPDVKMVENEESIINVKIRTSGKGTATEDLSVFSGDYVNIVAVPDECNKFVGWYSGKTLVSEDATYRFCVKEDVELKAVFEENNSLSSVATAPTYTEKRFILIIAAILLSAVAVTMMVILVFTIKKKQSATPVGYYPPAIPQGDPPSFTPSQLNNDPAQPTQVTEPAFASVENVVQM